MSETDRQRFEDLKEDYALNALPEEERRWFEAYLARHPELRPEVEELCAISALLSLAPEEQEPPEDLRRRVLAAVEAEAPRRREAQPSTSGRTLPGGRRMLLAAAALLLVGLLSWNVFLQAELEELQQANQTLREQAARGAEVREISLHSTDGLRQGEAKVIAIDGNRAVLVAENMPPAPEGKTMQIWVIKNGEPLPAGLFRPQEDEGATATMIERPLEGAEAIAITVEPAGGSPKPTGDPVMTAKV